MSSSAGKIKHIVEGLEHKKSSDYYRFGFDYFGPFLFGYTKWLYKITKEKGLSKILFFARDGYMMQKAYKLLPDGLDTEYVYFSRKSLRQALLCRARTFEELINLYSWKRYVTVAEILDFFGFETAEFEKIAKDNGLELSKAYRFEDIVMSDELKSLYETLKDEIRTRSEKQAELLLTYISQIGLDDKCAIVDIGWHGNMQYYLEEFLSVNGLASELKGFYVGINSTRTVRGEEYGYLYSDEDLSLRKNTLCFLGIYEKLFQSLEGSTTGYEFNNGIVEATKAEYEYSGDNDMKQSIEELQNGALDCFSMLCKTADESIAYKEYAMPLLHYGERPKLKEALLFKNMYVIDGIKLYFLPQKPLSKYKLKELKRDLSNSMWKTGFMKAAFKVPFPYDWIYKVMRK